MDISKLMMGLGMIIMLPLVLSISQSIVSGLIDVNNATGFSSINFSTNEILFIIGLIFSFIGGFLSVKGYMDDKDDKSSLFKIVFSGFIFLLVLVFFVKFHSFLVWFYNSITNVVVLGFFVVAILMSLVISLFGFLYYLIKYLNADSI